MRGEEPVAVVEALKARALPEDGGDRLLEFLIMYRDAVQQVVDRVWSAGRRLSRRELHRLFFSDLVLMGFRTHHAREIYLYAKNVVDSARNSNGGKPTIRKLSARVDEHDYVLDLDSMTLTLKLHGDHEVKLRLVTSRERVEKFRGWSNSRLTVKYEGGVFWVAIYFRKVAKPVEPRSVMAVDLNFDNVTIAVFTLNGRLLKVKRFKTPHRKILTHKIWVERIKKRYPRSWRRIKGVRRAVRRHGERISNISWDYSHKLGDLVAELALKYRSLIILEDLNKFKGKRDGDRLGQRYYRRIQFCIEYEAMERGLRVVKVDPRGTSTSCPRCGGRLIRYSHRVLKCWGCGFIGDRDVVATLNLYKKYVLKHSRCGVSGVALNAPEMGKRDEAMTVGELNPFFLI